MITAILVDDEPINNSNLTALLARHCSSVTIIASAGTVDEAYNKIAEHKPDIVFLDIEMPGKNGFDLLRLFEKPDFEVIFVTAYNHYSLMAIKFSALDYLLKPISSAELVAAVAKAETSVASKNQHTRLQNLFHLLDKKQADENEKIALPTQKEIFLVPVKNIVRCESSNNYTKFFLSNGASHLISRPLYEYDEMLAPYGFIRCHQSHLVNRKHVASILNEDAGYLMMDGSGDKIPIAKQRKKEVRNALKI